LNPLETRALDDIAKAIALMLQGSLCDARDLISQIQVPDSTPLRVVTSRLADFLDNLTGELASKELALASVQTAMWELDAAKERLQASEARFRTALESIGDGVIATNTHGVIDFMNSVAEQLTGWSVIDATGQPVTQVFHIVNAHTRAEASNPAQRVFNEGVVVGLANHTLLIARDQTERQIADSCAPIRDADERIVGAVLVFRDVTEEYRRREQIRESEERYRALFEGAGAGILVAEVETKTFLYGNNLWCELFGYEPTEVAKLGVPEIHPAEALPMVIKAFDGQAGGNHTAVELPCKRKDGSVFFADIRARTISLNGKLCSVAFFTDVTERKVYEQKLAAERAMRLQTEIELRHAQKLEAVGQLAAGIAHEINTPTQFVGDSIHFLANSYKDTQQLIAHYRRAIDALTSAPGFEALAQQIRHTEEDADLAYLEENSPAAFTSALDGISRISTIVSAMKDFAHPDQREKSPADLNRALQTTLTIAKNEYKYVADAETDFAELPPVMCHAGDLNQVFLNLIVNAAHAIVELLGRSGARGRITVRTAMEGTYARIDISDTGCGIPEKIWERVFDPFFTTKEVGRGSGQGLAIARSIVVDRHGGTLTFVSQVGHGTTFTIRLPISGAVPRATPSSP
jgi:PAS domain S-box-containing protein